MLSNQKNLKILFMKKLLLIPLVILFVSTGCKKEPVINSAPPQVLPPPPPQIGQNEMIFKDIEWDCSDFGCSVVIEDFYSFIPRDKPLLVFFRRTSLSTWQLLNPFGQQVITDIYYSNIYKYNIWNNKFWIDAKYDETENVDVKIQY